MESFARCTTWSHRDRSWRDGRQPSICCALLPRRIDHRSVQTARLEIIEELEPHRRGVYSGAVGWVGPDGAMDTCIAIRTLVHGDGTLRFKAGGGIIHDSGREAEYEETFDKASAMLRWLQQVEVRHVDCEDRRQPGH